MLGGVSFTPGRVSGAPLIASPSVISVGSDVRIEGDGRAMTAHGDLFRMDGRSLTYGNSILRPGEIELNTVKVADMGEVTGQALNLTRAHGLRFRSGNTWMTPDGRLQVGGLTWSPDALTIVERGSLLLDVRPASLRIGVMSFTDSPPEVTMGNVAMRDGEVSVGGTALHRSGTRLGGGDISIENGQLRTAGFVYGANGISTLKTGQPVYTVTLNPEGVPLKGRLCPSRTVCIEGDTIYYYLADGRTLTFTFADIANPHYMGPI